MEQIKTRIAIYAFFAIVFVMVYLPLNGNGEISINQQSCEGVINRIDFKDAPTSRNSGSYFVRIYVKNSKIRVCTIATSAQEGGELYKTIRGALPRIGVGKSIKASCIASNYQPEACFINNLWVNDWLIAHREEQETSSIAYRSAISLMEFKKWLSSAYLILLFVGVVDLILLYFRRPKMSTKN